MTDVPCTLCQADLPETGGACPTCGGTIIRGATKVEKRGGFKIGFVIGLLLGGGTAGKFGTVWSMTAIPAFAIAGGLLLAWRISVEKKDLVRVEKAKDAA